MFIKYERGVIVLDTSTIVGLISSLGFPIVSCIAMARYMTKSIDNNNKRIDEVYQLRTTEMLDVIKQNTEVMTKLCDKFDNICKKESEV